MIDDGLAIGGSWLMSVYDIGGQFKWIAVWHPDLILMWSARKTKWCVALAPAVAPGTPVHPRDPFHTFHCECFNRAVTGSMILMTISKIQETGTWIWRWKQFSCKNLTMVLWDTKSAALMDEIEYFDHISGCLDPGSVASSRTVFTDESRLELNVN